MYFKCKPDLIGETISTAQKLLSIGNVIIEKTVMSELSFIALFGGDMDTKARNKMSICGVPIELEDSAGKYVVIHLASNDKRKPKKKRTGK